MPMPTQTKLFIRVIILSFVSVWVIDSLRFSVRTYVTFLGFPMTTFFYAIESQYHVPVIFRLYWILHSPKVITVGFLLEFIIVFLYLRNKDRIVSLVPSIFLFFYISLLK